MRAAGEIGNIFCAGEKLGAMVGHTEAIVTGSLSGHNAARRALGMELLTLPDSLAVGDYVNHVIGEMKKPECRSTKYTFSGSVYFERMKKLGLYTVDLKEIRERVQAASLDGVMEKKLA
jgi:folate-dependent tRNA-U54 methylase TrmFO/GidA